MGSSIYRDDLDGSETIRVLFNGRWWFVPIGALAAHTAPELAALAARVAALEAALAAVGSRVATVEARPEEAAHFTASARMPALMALASSTLTLTGLVPKAAGDRVRKGEAVQAEPAAALPPGAVIAATYAPADDTVAVQIVSTVLVAAGAAPIAWNITALR